MTDMYTLPDAHLSHLLNQAHFGSLVTTHESGLRTTPIPFYAEKRDDAWIAVTHLARHNPQATDPITGPATAVFHVMDAYVSNTWYASNKVLPNVPTWDYVSIQMPGTVTIIDDPQRALQVAAKLTHKMGDGDELKRVASNRSMTMATHIVAVELTADRVIARAKMSQDRHPDDIRGVIEQLESAGKTDMAAFLREVSLPVAEERFGRVSAHRAATEIPLHGKVLGTSGNPEWEKAQGRQLRPQAGF